MAATEAKKEFLKKRIMRIRKKYPKMTIEMEAQNLTQVRLALDCAVDIILLDNMPKSILRRAIAMIRSLPSRNIGKRQSVPHPQTYQERAVLRRRRRALPNGEGSRRDGPLIEISGGVNLKRAGALARLGPDRISIGQLTHSPRALDISFEIK